MVLVKRINGIMWNLNREKKRNNKISDENEIT